MAVDLLADERRHESCGQCFRTQDDGAQIRFAKLREALREQHGEVRGRHVDQLDATVHDRVHEGPRIAAFDVGGNQNGVAARERAEDLLDGDVETNGGEQQFGRGMGQFVVERAAQSDHEIGQRAMFDDARLGRTGRTGRVGDVGGIGQLRASMQGSRLGRAIAAQRDNWQREVHRAVAHEHARAAIGNQMANAFDGQRGIDRQARRAARHDAGDAGHHPLRAIRHQRHHVARTRAGALDAGGQARSRRGQLAVGKMTLVVKHRVAAGMPLRNGGEHVDHSPVRNDESGALAKFFEHHAALGVAHQIDAGKRTLGRCDDGREQTVQVCGQTLHARTREQAGVVLQIHARGFAALGEVERQIVDAHFGRDVVLGTFHTTRAEALVNGRLHHRHHVE